MDSGRADQWYGSAPGIGDGGTAPLGPGAWGLGSFRFTPPGHFARASAPTVDIADHGLCARLNGDVAYRDGLRATIF
jgi:hypothetical protein